MRRYRPYADQVINLFKDSKIEKRKEAEKLLDQLSSRGKGPQAAIQKITEKYSKAESATGKLDRRELKEYFVSGVTQHIITYEQKLKKAGIIKARSYEIETPFAIPIKAKNKDDAENQAQAWSAKTWIQGEGADSYAGKSKKFKGAKINSIQPVSSFKAASEGAQLMKAAQPVEYSFIHLKLRVFVCLINFLAFIPHSSNISTKTILLIYVMKCAASSAQLRK